MPRRKLAPNDTIYSSNRKGGKSQLSSATKIYHSPIFTAAPVELRRVEESPNAVPEGWQGSDLEYMVFQALGRQGKQPNTDFTYQSSLLGGHVAVGGIVADFIVYDPPIAINVQGDIWHYGMGEDRMAIDQVQRATMESLGYTVVYIDQEDIMNGVDYYVAEALMGHDHSKSPH